jgi:hypothetical protein
MIAELPWGPARVTRPPALRAELEASHAAMVLAEPRLASPFRAHTA